VLAGCVAAASGRAGWAGMWLGLAIAAKQQGLFFVPLALALVVVGGRCHASRIRAQPPCGTFHVSRITNQSAASLWDVSRFTATLLLTLLPLFLWDFFRRQAPGFWQLSLDNYGGLSTGPGSFSERWAGFTELLQYATVSPLLNLIFLIGLPILLIYDFYQILKSNVQTHLFSQRPNLLSAATVQPPSHQATKPPNHPTTKPPNHQTTKPSNHQTIQPPNHQTPYFVDWLFALFCLVFLLGHVWYSFQIWDRYLLGLMPFLALLLARILLLPWSIIREKWLFDHQTWLTAGGTATALGIGLLLALTLARPVQEAVNARYPLGSNSRALQGIDQVVAYLQGQVGANHTLYHHWLGPHWHFYLRDYPYDLQYWPSAQALAIKAQPGHLIAFPTWESETEARLALAETGLVLHELVRGYSPLGYPSIILYRIDVAED
jgi:hypothetical protein